ncbi:MAG: glucose-1-phosphate cytidylyltransferase [Rhodospirillales bacterium]|nr:glucose-1-phosphate cytidylyltransferase [Rhodospirillales bacterium]
MKCVIVAGGYGSRLSEETQDKPKPMVEIGGMPILWHIMKTYSHFGIQDFIICLGYKGYLIKEYFANYHLHMSDVTFDLSDNSTIIHQSASEPWRVTLVDTGVDVMTGGRLTNIAHHLDDEPFCFTYGDGVADIDVAALVDQHKSHGKLATVTAVRQPGRFGHLQIADGAVTGFSEKPDGDWINGGFFVLEPGALDTISRADVSWEREPMEQLSRDGQLDSYLHQGFWQCMDTLRDKNHLEDLWQSGNAPWKVWNDGNGS